MSDIAGCCELTLEKICEDEEEQKHLHMAMEKVGWSTDDSGELQCDLTKVLRPEDYYMAPAAAMQAASRRQEGILEERRLHAEVGALGRNGQAATGRMPASEGASGSRPAAPDVFDPTAAKERATLVSAAARRALEGLFNDPLAYRTQAGHSRRMTSSMSRRGALITGKDFGDRPADKELEEELENAIADAKEEVDDLKEKVKAATAAEKKALQSKHKAEKELKVSRDQLAEVKAAEADLEASLRNANGDVARALKSLRSMTALKTFVYSRQDAPPCVALRTISKAELGDKWASHLNAPRAEYDTGIAAKASAVERVQKKHEEAEKELELQQGLLEHHESGTTSTQGSSMR